MRKIERHVRTWRKSAHARPLGALVGLAVGTIHADEELPETSVTSDAPYRGKRVYRSPRYRIEKKLARLVAKYE